MDEAELTDEEYREAIAKQVRDALRRGHRPSNIGFTLTNDAMFVGRLLAGEHRYTRMTLQKAYRRLPLLDTVPPMTTTAKRLLIS